MGFPVVGVEPCIVYRNSGRAQAGQHGVAPMQRQHGVDRGRLRRTHDQHAHRHGQLRHLQAVLGQGLPERSAKTFSAPVGRLQPVGKGGDGRTHGVGQVGRQRIGRGGDVGVVGHQPVGQRPRGVAAVLEQAAQRGQAFVGRHATLVQLCRHQRRQRRVVHGLQVLGVDPAQLGLVELGGAAAQVFEVEPGQELRTREDFVVAMAPAQARQVVDLMAAVLARRAR